MYWSYMDAFAKIMIYKGFWIVLSFEKYSSTTILFYIIKANQNTRDIPIFCKTPFEISDDFSYQIT